MLFLLDANTLIDAKRDYYPIDRVPEYWQWLVYNGKMGRIKIPQEVYIEFNDTRTADGTKDELAEWADRPDTKEALVLNEEPDMDAVARVTYGGYMPNPTDEDLRKMGQDPFLIAYALKDIESRCVVTSERSKPKALGSNRKIPDVCAVFGIRCIHGFQLTRELDFSTDWEQRVGSDG